MHGAGIILCWVYQGVCRGAGCRVIGARVVGLVFKANRLLYPPTLGPREIKKEKKVGTRWPCRAGNLTPSAGVPYSVRVAVWSSRLLECADETFR